MDRPLSTPTSCCGAKSSWGGSSVEFEAVQKMYASPILLHNLVNYYSSSRPAVALAP